MKLPPYYTIVWFIPKEHSYLREPFLGYLHKYKVGGKHHVFSKTPRIYTVSHRDLSVPLTEVVDWKPLTEEEKEKGESH